MKFLALSIAALLALSTHAGAATAPPCEFSDDLSQVRGVSVVAGEGRAYFGATPEAAGACAGKGCAYLLPGDAVVTSETSGGATCAGFQSKSGKTTQGWLPAARLAPAKPKPSDWAGYWGEKDRSISIRADSDKLAIDAHLVFQGGGPVFSGAFKAKAAASGPMLEFAIDDKGRPVDAAKAERACRVKLALVGPLLLVHDEGCVGAGSAVTFEGAYTKAKR
ncbi:MAG: hypothetical protein KDJ44_19100 [Rhodoblastus sp.]|nr:hypothetical protein [Rhodoblastus sp.]